MHSTELEQQLRNKGWSDRLSLYSAYFDYVHYLNPVTQPKLTVVVISWRLHPDTITNFMILDKQRVSQNFELIFVDNGGQADEFSSLLPYINTYVRLNENTGAYLARNVGAVFCQSTNILFLEDDGIPDDQLIESYLMVHRKYDAYAVQGVYLEKTNTLLNYRQSHYYSGNKFFPKCSNLEGNTSYLASVFFEVGGWDDEINFGGGGRELSLRIYNRYPEYHKQIYSPISLIYHDYASSEEHLQSKKLKQMISFERLADKYDNWYSFAADWKVFQGNEGLLEIRTEWSSNEEEQFRTLYDQITLRNSYRIKAYEEIRVSLYDLPRLNDLIDVQHSSQKICIFGAGAFGELFCDILQLNDLRIDCFSDNNESLWNTEKKGIPIISPSELTRNYFVFIASVWSYEIGQQLVEVGLDSSVNYIVVY